jgi:catechol 2,3-dioxygenase-like lactoylglutathione lyase family enzyme
MLAKAPIAPTIPVTDLEKSREFYEGKLGLAVKQQDGEDGLLLEAGEGSMLYLYKRPPAPSEHTLASFHVQDLDKEMDDLIAKGVKFEHYDLPYLKTDEKGIAVMGDMRGAWFKDPDGNTLALDEESK